MFYFDTNDYSDKVNVLLRKHFNRFEEQDCLLPSWKINYMGEEIKDSRVEKTFIGKISGHSFFTSPESLWISVSDQQNRIVIRMPWDFSKVYLFCKKDELSLYRSILELLYQGYRYRAATQNAMMIHAAAIVFRGEGILFCGESGAGKSTQAILWRKYLNAKALNYDKPCILFSEGQLIAHGSPWSGKENLFLNEHAPLRSIVFVEKADYNDIKKMSYSEAFSSLLLHNYLLPANNQVQNSYFDLISNIIEKTPIYTLRCTIDVESVKTLYEELYCY